MSFRQTRMVTDGVIIQIYLYNTAYQQIAELPASRGARSGEGHRFLQQHLYHEGKLSSILIRAMSLYNSHYI
jgi:hypothetical protein